MLGGENETESNLQSDPKNLLTTEEDVANEIKEWMVTSKTDGHTSTKSYENAVEHIELKLGRSFFCFEATWTESQYVKTVLELWLEKSLEKAFDYMDDEKFDIREVSDVLSQLNSMDSFEDFYCKLNDVESSIRNWCDGECRYLKLILDQKDIFTSTSRFTNIVDCYFKQFTTSCIEKVFSQSLSDLVKDETNGKNHETFIIDLNDFLAIVNEDKNVLEKMLDPNFQNIYLEAYDNTGQDLIKEIVDMYVTSFKNDFLASVRTEEDLQAILDKDLEENKVIIENITDTDWQVLFRRLSRNVSSFLTTVGSQRAPGSIPEWFKRYQKVLSLLNDVEWTPKLQVLTKETCKRFLLPKTEIEFKEEGGKQIISIKGVAIFVSKMIGEMKRLKDENPDVEEIKIVGLKSVHIDCDLDNEIWHGINVGIVTDKLIVDGVINDESTEISSGVCWKISGQNSKEEDHQPMGEPRKPGESGGNVHVVCNKIINGKKWTIVSDGADGSAAYKWTKENFEELFPSISTSDREETVNSVLTILAEILPTENRTKGENILPGHKGNFLISGTTDDSSEITATFYRGKKQKQTLISIARNRAAQGGYGGDITIECFGNNEMDITSEIPFMGEDTRRKSLRAIKMGVYVASGSNGCTGKSTGDIAYINKIASKSTSKTEGKYYGFEKDQKIEVELDVIKKPRGDQNLYVKYRDEIKNKKRYTKLSMDSLKDMQVKVVDAVKKKAVIRQSLVRHLDQIDRRNQLIESIQKMLSNPTATIIQASNPTHSNSIGEILNEMENIVHQHHQLTIQRQQQQFDKIDQEQYVKSKIDSSRTFPKPKIIGRRPVYLNPLNARLNEHYIDDVDVYCLDELLTEEGITDSLLHCLFGQLNWEGKFVCRDADKFYKLIEKHGRENESQDSTLGSAELEILAEILEIKIHVYERHGSSSFQYTKTVDPKNIDNNEYFILYEDDGLWKRLSPNNNLKFFCKEFSPADDEQNCNPTYFEQLKHWIDKKDEVITSVENLNPQNKTPDKLFQLLLSRISNLNLNNDVEQTEKLTSAISSLAEWVEYYNTWNISPLFYLTIVEINEPNNWQFEFLLLELEDQFWKQWGDEEDRDNWRKDAREYLNRHERALRLFTQIAMKKEESDFSVSFEFNILLRLMEENIDIEEFFDDDEDIGQLSLINFYYKKSNQFKKQRNNIPSTHLPDCQTSTSESRNVGEIIFEMKKKVSKLDEIEQILNESNSKKFEFKEGVDRIVKTFIDKNEKYNKFQIFPKEEKSKPITDVVKTTTESFLVMMKKANKNKILNDKHICHKIVKFTDGGVCFNYEVTEYFLCVFDYAVELIMGFKLRDTQRVAITTLLVHGYLGHSKTLAQVSTGEGKSIIVAGLAIGFALFRTKKMKNNRRNNKVDVITSNDVLALRDSNLPVAKGGLKELYEFFNVTVANNSSKSADERIKAYSMDVVYGQLANFQRDYLLDEFYNRGIRGDRPTVYGIIDEVDCMLLDRGNNMLYLSHDIPGMEMLETLYVFIWEKIQHHSVEMVKSHILYDLYGQITEEDLENIHAPLGREESEKHAIWTHLIEKKVIDRQGRLLINEVSEITKEKIDYVPKNETMKEKTLNTKIVFYFQTIAERERRIRIPSHLLDFVDRHLETWLDNARRALELKQDEDYVIDHDRSDPSPDLNPRVIIIDPDTGTDQSSSQWDGALHQFLQLKEGCKLTLQSLKAVFMSNATYIGKYSNLAGLSGTLGSQPEQKFLEKLYKCDLITVPTAFPKRFSLKPAQIFKTKESWRKAVTEETRLTITDRSILIFCRSIKEVNVVYKHLKSATQDRNDKNKRIHRYTRDYEKFEFENSELDVGNVIVATNLAGRGTDIKISKKLEANGGLHICLTYFPDNERVEEQAMGRAARKGEPGSGILILCEEQTDQVENPGSSEEWGAEKMFVMKEEREWKERQRISRLEKDFNHTEVLERFFEEYTTDFSVKNVRNKYKEIEYLRENHTVQLPADDVLLNVIHESALDKWSLSLDEADYDFKCFGLQPGPFTIGVNNFYGDILQWITPGRKVPFAKHLAITKTEQIDKKEAADILTELIRSIDHFFYPAAFYYRAFIQLTEMKSENKKFEEEKIEFIRTLRRTETILNEHIDMHNFLCITYQSDRKPGPTSSFCEFNGYKEQKENNIKIFLCFLSSIQWLLGRRCSLSDLREASGETPKAPGCVEKCLKIAKHLTAKEKGGKDKETLNTLKQRRIRLEKVDEYFGKLMESKCIVFELNDPDAIPSDSEHQNLKITSVEKRSKLILRIADDYGVGASLEDKLNLIFDDKSLNEENVEQKLKKKIKIPCSRKAFWNELVKAEALKPLLDCNGTDCVIVSEDQLEELKLDKAYAIKFNFGGKSFHDGSNHLYVLYNPLYDIKQVLGEGKKLLFSKEYVKDSLLSEYCKRKRRFESNKIAQLNLTKLRDVNLESFGRLAMDDLRRHKIDRFEQKEIWNQLINQKIINGQGYLVPGYDFTVGFNYPDCPAYANAVTRLVEKKFVVEIVRMQWLKSTDNPSCLQAIHLLPRKPHRDMLGDLMAAHVISGARVTEDRDTNLQKEVENLTEYDEERKCMMEFLTSHQPVYAAKPITPDIFLDFIEYFLRENVFSELYVFRLVGFDRIIDIKDRKRNFRGIRTDSMWASLIITIGLASMGLGVAALIPQKFVEFKIPSKVCKNLLLIGGFSDISYVVETILSRKDFTWTDYGRQRIRSAKGRVKPINTIEDLLKLSRSSNRSFKDFFSSDEKDIPNSRPK